MVGKEPPMTDESAAIVLQRLVDSGKLSGADVAIMEETMKRDKIAKIHNHKIRHTDRWYTNVDDKTCTKGLRRISAYTEEKLYEKLYNHYFNVKTLENLLVAWRDYSRENTNRKEKTIKEDANVYNKYLKDDPIVKMDITKLKVKDFRRFFDHMFKDDPTRKQVNAVRTLIKQLYAQAVMEDVDVVCPLLQMDTYFKTKDYRQVDEVPGYDDEERIALLSHLQSVATPSIYDLSIMLMFCFTVRIGELRALKWSDIRDNYLHIDKQIDTEGNECDVKKKSKAGHRKLPISEFAWSILNQLPKDGEYILMKDNKVLNTDSFNARLKKRCNECGVRYLSSHKIRFSNCTTLLESGLSIRDVQYAMGHTDQRMTEHYYRPSVKKKANPVISTLLVNGLQTDYC